VVSFAAEVSRVSSGEQVVMVAEEDAALLADDTPASQLNNMCKHPSPQQFVGAFGEADCLGATSAGGVVEYTEDEMQQGSLCMMADVADSYEDRTMITMDRVSVVCDEETEDHECCELKPLSSSQALDHNG